MLKSRGLKEYLIVFLSLVGVSVLCILGRVYVPLFSVAENWVSDLRIAAFTPYVPQSRQNVVVAINEDTLAPLPYRSPVDRQFLSRLLQALEAKGARAFGVDILLDQPTAAAKDQQLMDALKGSKLPLVVAWADIGDGQTERRMSFMNQYLSGIPKGLAQVFEEPHDDTVRTMLVRDEEKDGGGLSLAASLVRAVGAELPAAKTLPLHFRGWPESGALPFAMFPAHTVEYRAIILSRSPVHGFLTAEGNHFFRPPGYVQVRVHAHILFAQKDTLSPV